ncbi:MAG: hypothetical protein RSE24_04300, partial [Oscillospiraceae bacterium]
MGEGQKQTNTAHTALHKQAAGDNNTFERYGLLAKGLKEVKIYMDINRGEVFYADLSPVIGCEQGGT